MTPGQVGSGPSWPSVQLRDVAKIQTGKSNKQDAVPGGEYPFFDRSQHVQRSNRFLFDTEAVIVPGEGAEFIPRYYDGPFDLHQRVYAITDFRGVDGKYLYYAMTCKRRYFTQVAIGSTVKSLRKGMFERFSFFCPPMDAQLRIAGILSTYDDLIENNRRRIVLLEQAARKLYREWFVRLCFPGHESTRIVDGLPERWERRNIADVCTSFDDGDWIETKDQGGEDFRLLQISNIGNNEFVETGNYRWINSETFRSLRCNEVLFGDILISRMPKPIGRAWLVYEQPWRMITAVDVTIARPDQTVVDPLYYLYHLNSQTHIARCELRATGATRPRISRKTMGALPILRPPMTLQLAFGQIASAINEQRNNLTGQNKVLAQARELLLPRLMSGEVAV